MGQEDQGPVVKQALQNLDRGDDGPRSWQGWMEVERNSCGKAI